MINMYLNALGRFDSVCDINGWQIATYLSMVNAVIVNTVAFVDVSAANPLIMQNISPNTYGYLKIPENRNYDAFSKWIK